MPYLTNAERETIICFNEQDNTARVFTYNRKMSNYLREQASDPQTKCRLLEDNLNGGLTFEVPKKWVKVRRTRQISEERRAELAALARERGFGKHV